MIFDIIKQAKQLIFDNSKSGLKATNAQDAIDELDNSLSELDFTTAFTKYGRTDFIVEPSMTTENKEATVEENGYIYGAVIVQSNGTTYSGCNLCINNKQMITFSTRGNYEQTLPFSPIRVLKGDIIKFQSSVGSGGVGHRPTCFFTPSK